MVFGTVYKKGLIKKGMSLAITLAALVIVYIASPSVEIFFRGVLPETMGLDHLLEDGGDLYQTLFLSGLKEQAAEYVTLFAARILSVVVTYVVARFLLRLIFIPLEALVKVPGLSLLKPVGRRLFRAFSTDFDLMGVLSASDGVQRDFLGRSRKRVGTEQRLDELFI